MIMQTSFKGSYSSKSGNKQKVNTQTYCERHAGATAPG